MNEANHLHDSDCTIDPATDVCTGCHVGHGDGCPECGGRGYHALDCSEVFIACPSNPETDVRECGCLNSYLMSEGDFHRSELVSHAGCDGSAVVTTDRERLRPEITPCVCGWEPSAKEAEEIAERLGREIQDELEPSF